MQISLMRPDASAPQLTSRMDQGAEQAIGQIADLSFSIPSASYVAINFPGYVRNVDRATQMLGGHGGIAAAVNSVPGMTTPFLSMRYRPEDGASHPLLAPQQPTNGLVLRVSRPMRRHADSATTPHGSGGRGDDPDPKLEVVASVPMSFSFTGECHTLLSSSVFWFTSISSAATRQPH